MRVLITGVTGFIGSHLARLLVREGYTVYALIRSTSNVWRIKDILQSLYVIRGDVVALNEWEQQLGKIQLDICFHLAWYAVPGKYLTSLENFNMVIASLRFASRLASLGCKKFIAAGTCVEYDTNLGYLSEVSPTKPRSPYAASKLALQLILEQLGSVTGMKVAWTRLFYLYGPSEDEQRLVPYVICSLLRNQVARVTEGKQVRDFLHVEDVAAAIWAVAQSDLTGPVNIGSGIPVTVRDIVTRIGAILGKSELIALGAVPYAAADPMFICANNSRLRSTTWVPRFDLDQGLSDTIEWWKQHTTRS